jgi:hypothetical protein
VQQSQRGDLDARTGPLVNRADRWGGGWSPGCFAWQMIASRTPLGSMKSGVVAVDVRASICKALLRYTDTGHNSSHAV